MYLFFTVYLVVTLHVNDSCMQTCHAGLKPRADSHLLFKPALVCCGLRVIHDLTRIVPGTEISESLFQGCPGRKGACFVPG